MKPQHLFSITFSLGLAAVIWVASTAIGGDSLVLVMTLVIGGVFTAGALELRRHHAQTQVLNQALSEVSQTSTDLSVWLAQVPEALRQPVRQRLQGERVSPPAPVVTPYLVGLLVMLGMLGTFLGMLVTLSGTAFALQSLTDIQGIRVAFSEPIKGLGLAFGASVAGVSTSAMLGLMATLVRRERLLAWRQIDALSNGPWQVFNQHHLLQQAWVKLQANTQALPQLVEQMGQWMSRIEALQTQFHAQWLAQQERHQSEVEKAHQTLAANVEQTLGQHLLRSSEKTAEQLRALANDTLGQVAQSNQQTAEQLRALASDTLVQVAQSNHQTSAQLQSVAVETMAELGAQAAQVHRSLTQAHEQLLQNQQAQSQAHLGHIEAKLVEHLGQLGASLEAPLARLMDISAQAPQAAAEIIGELRQRINASMARDNELLAERAQIMDHLAQASQSFGEQVQSQGQLMGDLSIQLRSSAIEVASLGQSFGAAVQTLHQSQGQTLTQLQQLEAALGQSIARSDEQMDYYVAQAREVIELSLSAQKPMLESLERVSRRLSPEEA